MYNSFRFKYVAETGEQGPHLGESGPSSTACCQQQEYAWLLLDRRVEEEEEEEEEDEEEDEEEEEDACFVLCMTGIVTRFVFVEGQFHCS